MSHRQNAKPSHSERKVRNVKEQRLHKKYE